MTNEVGRSMVETLGILAIMGVLSVVGLAGYNSAMDKSKANNLIQEAQKRAVIVAGQIGFNNQTPSLAEFLPYNTTSSGTFGDVITTGLTGQFGIQVSNVSKSICQNILNTIGDTTPIRRLSKEGTPTTPISSCDEDNAFLFIYNNDMTANDTMASPKSCRTVNDCATACATCEIPEDEEVGICTNECEEPVKLCEADTDCNSENKCMVCDTEAGLCKNGCERAEYLAGDGQSFIDTKIPGQASFIYKITAGYYDSSMTTNTALFGSAWSGNCVFIQMNPLGDGSLGKTYWHGMKNADYDNNLIGRYSEMEFGNGYRIDDGIETRTSANITSNTNKSVKIFGITSSNSTKIRIKSFKILGDDREELIDLIPVISPDKKACMFDTVSKTLFCGTGTFKTDKDN